jgi:D-alanyl-D-alanine carboxypeptidase (penicillin-binding protein 5/6)
LLELLRDECWPAGRRNRALTNKRNACNWEGDIRARVLVRRAARRYANAVSTGLIPLKLARSPKAVAIAMCLGLASNAHAQTTPQSAPIPDDIPVAILVDLSSGQVLHQRNADRRFVPASITKAMTTLVAFELIEQGQLRLDQRFTFTPSAFAEWGGRGSTMFLNAGDTLTAESLLDGITTISANDGSVVLAEGVAGSRAEWLRLMNAKALQIGMTNSHFGTPNGWPDEGRTFVTARDLVKLGAALARGHPELYARFVGQRELTHGGITQPNHDPLSGQVRGGDGIKTGFTNEAGYGFLGSAERGGRRLVLVVAGADRSRARDRAARAYVEWGFSAFRSRPLFDAEEVVATARVQGGQSRRVSLVSLHDIAATLPVGEDREVTMTVHYDGPLRAPIAKGQEVAELEIAVAGMPPSRVPLVAAQPVDRAGPIARLINGLMSWLA